MMNFIQIIFFAFFFQISSGVSIDDFGAISNENSIEAAYKNSKAIVDAAKFANKNQTDREILIPPGKVFVVFNITLENLFNVTLRIDGILMTSNNIDEWESLFPLDRHVEDAGHPACLLVVVKMILWSKNFSSGNQIEIFLLKCRCLW